MATIYEEESVLKDLLLPFINSEDDRKLLRKWELENLKQISLVSHFSDIDQMGVEFDLKEDFDEKS